MITISDLSVRIAGRLLIENATVSIPDGMKAGLVGRNGAGKSTLFRVLTGDLSPEAGSVLPAASGAHRSGGAGSAGALKNR